jgi:hypothetical protein|nr:MAG TPA: tail assembly chaperone protein [Caudoviricetes sp.]
MEHLMKLTEPVKFGDTELTELHLKSPKGKLIKQIGLPFSFNQDGSFEMLTDRCAKYISECASIPMSTVDELGAEDYLQICAEITGFFGQRTAS